MTILLFLLAVSLGFFAYPIVMSIFGFHECDYEVLFNRVIDDVPIGCRYVVTEAESRKGYTVNTSLVCVTYKKCRKCGHVKVTISNGTDRKFSYNEEHVRAIVEIMMKKEKDAADAALLDRANARLAVGDTEEKLDGLAKRLMA